MIVKKKAGLLGDSNPGPLAPEARIIPLDQAAINEIIENILYIKKGSPLTLNCLNPESKRAWNYYDMTDIIIYSSVDFNVY